MKILQMYHFSNHNSTRKKRTPGFIFFPCPIQIEYVKLESDP